jgi:hypothetical protein
VSLRQNRAFRFVAYSMAGLALLAFALRVVQKVSNGQWLETYHSAKLIRWTYGSSFVLLVFLLLAAIVAGVIRLVYWLRERSELKRLED